MQPQPTGYQTLFALLRERGETPAWMIAVFLLFLVLVVGIIYWGWRRQREREAAYLHRSFNALAEEKGLDEEESQQVWNLALAGRCEHPLLLLSSASAFDQCVTSAPDAIPESRLPMLRHKLGFTVRPLGWALVHTREIAVGQHLWVGFKRGETARFCHCVLVENNGDGLLVTPIVKADEDAFKDVRENDLIYTRFWRRGDTEYQFRTGLLPQTDPDRVTLWLAHTDQISRVQRRDFFRLPVRIPVAIHSIGNAEDAELPPETLRARSSTPSAHGAITDLSAGGAALLIAKPMAFGAHIWLAPTGQSPFALFGIACRVLDISSEGPDAHRHRLEFVNLDDVQQDALARQIHHAQIR